MPYNSVVPSQPDKRASLETYVDQDLSSMPRLKKAFLALLGALMCFTGRATMRKTSGYRTFGAYPSSCFQGSRVLRQHSLTALNLLCLEDRAWAFSKSINPRHRLLWGTPLSDKRGQLFLKCFGVSVLLRLTVSLYWGCVSPKTGQLQFAYSLAKTTLKSDSLL